LSLDEISKKPKKMKLVFRKYMEFENGLGNQNKLNDLRTRVEKYLETAFAKDDGSDSDKDAKAEKDEDEEMAESGSGSGEDSEEGEEEMESSDD